MLDLVIVLYLVIAAIAILLLFLTPLVMLVSFSLGVRRGVLDRRAKRPTVLHARGGRYGWGRAYRDMRWIRRGWGL